MNQFKEEHVKDKQLCETYKHHTRDEFEHSVMLNNQDFSKKINLQNLVQDTNEENTCDSPSEYSDVINWGNISLNNETTSSGKKMNNTLPWRRRFSNKIKRKSKNYFGNNENTYLDKAPVTRKVWQE
jgi:hypothetical protein